LKVNLLLKCFALTSIIDLIVDITELRKSFGTMFFKDIIQAQGFGKFMLANLYAADCWSWN